jgi:hypothetical protein
MVKALDQLEPENSKREKEEYSRQEYKKTASKA